MRIAIIVYGLLTICPISAQVTFDGVVALPLEQVFALTDRQSEGSKWVRVGDTFAGVTVLRYIVKSETLVVQDSHGRRELKLSKFVTSDRFSPSKSENEAIVPDETGWLDAEKLALGGDEHFEKIMLSYSVHIELLKKRVSNLDVIRDAVGKSSLDASELRDKLRAAEEAVDDEQKRMFWVRCLVAQQVRERYTH